MCVYMRTQCLYLTIGVEHHVPTGHWLLIDITLVEDVTVLCVRYQ